MVITLLDFLMNLFNQKNGVIEIIDLFNVKKDVNKTGD